MVWETGMLPSVKMLQVEADCRRKVATGGWGQLSQSKQVVGLGVQSSGSTMDERLRS